MQYVTEPCAADAKFAPVTPEPEVTKIEFVIEDSAAEMTPGENEFEVKMKVHWSAEVPGLKRGSPQEMQLRAMDPATSRENALLIYVLVNEVLP